MLRIRPAERLTISSTGRSGVGAGLHAERATAASSTICGATPRSIRAMALAPLYPDLTHEAIRSGGPILLTNDCGRRTADHRERTATGPPQHERCWARLAPYHASRGLPRERH